MGLFEVWQEFSLTRAQIVPLRFIAEYVAEAVGRQPHISKVEVVMREIDFALSLIVQADDSASGMQRVNEAATTACKFALKAKIGVQPSSQVPLIIEIVGGE